MDFIVKTIFRKLRSNTSNLGRQLLVIMCYFISYPWSEDVEVPNRFMKTRAPAWCDRVLMNEHAYNNLCSTNNQDVTYDAIGQRACTGDHKVEWNSWKFIRIQKDFEIQNLLNNLAFMKSQGKLKQNKEFYFAYCQIQNYYGRNLTP